MNSQISNSLKQVLVAQIASNNDLRSGQDFIPCKYNGWNGALEDVSSIGPDTRWFGKKKVSADPDFFETGYGYAVIFKAIDGVVKCLIPNNSENVKILEALPARKQYVTEMNKHGHTVNRAVGSLPPLYERLDTAEGGGIDLGTMSKEEKLSLAAELFKSLQMNGDLPAGAPEVPASLTPAPVTALTPAPEVVKVESPVVEPTPEVKQNQQGNRR